MKYLKKVLLKHFPEWNQRIHTEVDAYEFCERNRIITIETDLIKDMGEYRMREGYPFIFLHKFIEARYRPWVLFHEIGHFMFHPTSIAHFSDEVTKRKAEKEANFVSATLLMPQSLLRNKTLAEIQEDTGHPRKIILYRKHICDNEKI